MTSAAIPVQLEADERELLLRMRGRPMGLAVMSENLGLSGTTGETRALCGAIDTLEAEGLIEDDPTTGFVHVRWRVTEHGRAWIRERDIAAMETVLGPGRPGRFTT